MEEVVAELLDPDPSLSSSAPLESWSPLLLVLIQESGEVVFILCSCLRVTGDEGVWMMEVLGLMTILGVVVII